MKFAITADLHFSKYSGDKVTEINISEKLNSLFNSINYLKDYCQNNNIYNIIIAGDIIHTKSYIYSICQNFLLNFFEENEKFTFFIIDGNHDLSSKDEKAISALKFLDKIKNVKRFTNKKGEMFENILFVPYSNELVDTIKNNSSDILVSHFGLNEGILDSGISIKSDLSIKDLKDRYRKVLLGHYHKAQQYVSPEFELYYTGSLIHLDRGEANEDKRFLVFDSETLNIESVESKGFKKYIEIEIKDEDDKDEKLVCINKFINEGHDITVRNLSSNELSWLPENISVIKKPNNSEYESRNISLSMSQRERFKRYCELQKLDVNEIDNYVDIALDIIEKSSCQGVIK